MELKQYWLIVKRRLWLIALLVVIGATATGVGSAYLIDKQYEASSKIIVNQKEGAVGTAALPDVRTIDFNVEIIKTYKEIIRTPRIMNVVIQEYPGLKTSVGELISKVSVSTVNGTQVMSVTAKDSSYSRAAEMANAVSRVFQEEIPKLMKVDNVNILFEADPGANAEPSSPNPLTNALISVVLLLVVGIGLAFLLDYLDDTVKSEEDVREWAGLATIADIPNATRSRRTKGSKNANLDNPIRGGTGATIHT